MTQGKSHIIVPSAYLGMGAGKLAALLSRIRLFPDRLLGFVFGGGGPCTALSPGLRSGGLESKFERSPRHPGQEGDGLVLLVPGV